MNSKNNPQGVGENYNKNDFKKSQDIGWKVLKSLKEKILPGMNEKDARAIYSEILNTLKIEKNWHPPKIRFGPNTIKSFRELSDENYRLKENDIFFLDVGPIINGYESDVGKTFTIGKNLHHNMRKLFQMVKKFLNPQRINF